MKTETLFIHEHPILCAKLNTNISIPGLFRLFPYRIFLSE